MARARCNPRPRPDRTFALLSTLSAALVGLIAWATHHLLLAGAPAVAAGGAWPGVACLLLPLGNDLTTHAASYAFLLAIGAGFASSLRTLVRQHQQTQTLVRACLAHPSRYQRSATSVARHVGLAGRLDVVDVAAPLAFCYGYLHPRVLVSRGLVAALTRSELAALLLHEREHLRQHDPLKVAVGKLYASAVFFVPAVGALYRRYLVEKELAADNAAIAAQGSARSLATALALFLERGVGPGAPAFSAAADEALEARLDALLGDPVRLGHIPLLRSAMIILLASLALVLAAPVQGRLTLTSHELVDGCHLAS